MFFYTKSLLLSVQHYPLMYKTYKCKISATTPIATTTLEGKTPMCTSKYYLFYTKIKEMYLLTSWGQFQHGGFLRLCSHLLQRDHLNHLLFPRHEVCRPTLLAFLTSSQGVACLLWPWTFLCQPVCCTGSNVLSNWSVVHATYSYVGD